MILRVSDQTENAILDAMRGRIESGELHIYDGDMPTSASTPISNQRRLATLAFSSTTLRNFTISARMGEGEAVATGIATWARIYAKDGSPVLDCDAGEDDDCAVSLNSEAIKKGGPIITRSFLLSMKPAE